MSARAGYKRFLITLQRRLIAMQEPSGVPSDSHEGSVVCIPRRPSHYCRGDMRRGRTLPCGASGGREAGFSVISFGFPFIFVSSFSLYLLLLFGFVVNVVINLSEACFCFFLVYLRFLLFLLLFFVSIFHLAWLWYYLLRWSIICHLSLLVFINRNNCLLK